MPFASGTYTAPSLPGTWNPAVSGGTQNVADFNTLLADLAAGITSAANFAQTGQTVVFETGAVATGTTTILFVDTPPTNTQGDQYMSLSITPKSATSRLVIDVTVNLCNSVSGNCITAALFQDSTANALAAAWQTGQGANSPLSISFRHSMTSSTTSATTFKVRIGAYAASTTTFNGQGGSRIYGGVLASSISIREVP